MFPRLFAVLAALASPSWAAAAKPPSPSETIGAFVRFQAPKGWQPEEYANGGGADPVKAFVDGADRIVVRVFGAPGSGYKDPAAFLAGPAASTLGRKPETAGTASAAGRRLTVYKRGFPVNQGDPHTPSGRQQMLGSEVFVILPASKGRFLVLSYARESPALDPERRGEKAWAAFLKTVKTGGRKT